MQFVLNMLVNSVLTGGRTGVRPYFVRVIMHYALSIMHYELCIMNYAL